MDAFDLIHAKWLCRKFLLPRLNDEQGNAACRVNGQPRDPGIYAPKATPACVRKAPIPGP
jgi:hypothetical protein